MTHDGVPAPFDDEHLSAVASENAIAVERLRELLTAHQATMARLPGVENLVYEWRKQFGATVIARSEEWFFVAAPEWAWEEFADDLGADDAEMAALIEIHRTTVGRRTDRSPDDLDDVTPMVLLRD